MTSAWSSGVRFGSRGVILEALTTTGRPAHLGVQWGEDGTDAGRPLGLVVGGPSLAERRPVLEMDDAVGKAAVIL